MKILVTGREGQIARSIAARAAAHEGVEIILAGRPELDLLKPETVQSAIVGARPDVVVSAAAYTEVDRAEDDPDQAFAANAAGAEAVAAAAAQIGAAVIHLSTDYVFAGDRQGEYVETDATDPQGVYGRSKLEGEKAVAAANPRHVILRTAWVYSPFGRNFVKTMLRLGADRDIVRIVADQWGNPTAAEDIAEGVLRVAAACSAKSGSGSQFGPGEQLPAYGVFHLAGEGSTSWAGLARHIFTESARLGGPSAQVEEIETADYPTKARRPANSRLSCEKFLRAYGWRPPAWQDSCRRVVERLLSAS